MDAKGWPQERTRQQSRASQSKGAREGGKREAEEERKKGREDKEGKGGGHRQTEPGLVYWAGERGRTSQMSTGKNAQHQVVKLDAGGRGAERQQAAWAHARHGVDLQEVGLPVVDVDHGVDATAAFAP